MYLLIYINEWIGGHAENPRYHGRNGVGKGLGPSQPFLSTTASSIPQVSSSSSASTSFIKEYGDGQMWGNQLLSSVTSGVVMFTNRIAVHRACLDVIKENMDLVDIDTAGN